MPRRETLRLDGPERRISVRLSKRQADWLDAYADARGVSLNLAVDHAIQALRGQFPCIKAPGQEPPFGKLSDLMRAEEGDE